MILTVDNCPFGDLTYGINSIVPVDLLHGFCGGVLKNVLFFFLAILIKCNPKSDYRDRMTTLCERMANMPRYPNVPGFAKTRFQQGILILYVLLCTYMF